LALSKESPEQCLLFTPFLSSKEKKQRTVLNMHAVLNMHEVRYFDVSKIT